MSWDGYQTPTSELVIGKDKKGQPIMGSVRGLNIDDFSVLLANHLEVITEAAALYAEKNVKIFNEVSLQKFTLLVIQRFPTIVTEVISIAADNPALREKKLHLGLQMTAMAEIARLTIQDAGGLGNLLAILGVALTGALEDGQAEGSLESMKLRLSHVFTGGSERTLAS